jgi:hypothetical protein
VVPVFFSCFLNTWKTKWSKYELKHSV